MMLRNRVLAGILVAVVIAGGLGLATAQFFPSESQTATSVTTVTSTATSTATLTSTTTTSATTSSSTSILTTLTVTSTATTTTTTSVSTATSVSSSTTTATLTSTTSIVSSATSATSTTCGTEYCGSFSSRSQSLSSGNSSMPYSTLTFTLVNFGNLNLTTVGVSIDGNQVAQVSGVAIGQTVTYLIQLAPGISVASGQDYQVQISSTTLYGAGPSTEFSVVAR